jgi:uncharacterized protein
MKNAETIQQIYAAFGRGDVPFILNQLSDSVDWEYGADNSKNIPWLQHGKGKAAAQRFFESLATLNFTKFVPKHILEGENIVVGIIDLEATVLKTGKKITEEDEPHIWHFDASGKISKFRHRADTLQHYLANQG